MELPDSLPSSQTEKDIALALFRAGTALKGKNLRKATWREIAAFFMRRGPLQVEMWGRLASDATRDDALRVLRIIRKRREQAQFSRRGSGRIAQTASLTRNLENGPQSNVAFDKSSDHNHPACEPWEDYNSECAFWEEYDSEYDYIFPVPRRFMSAAEQVIKNYDYRHRLNLLPGIEATAIDRSPDHSCKRPNEPIELRLSRHSQIALGRFGAPGFERVISEGIGDPENLDVLSSAVSSRDALAIICAFAPFWIRPPVDWDGETRIVDHLFVRESVPDFLYAQWTLDAPEVKWLYWFILLAQNGSLHRAAKYFSWNIARKFQYHLKNAPAGVTPLEAAVYAEVARMGGCDIDFYRLRHDAFVVDPTEPSDGSGWGQFWEETVRWFVSNHDEMHCDQAASILDWAVHEFTEAAERHTQFCWKGRTVRAVLARSEEYRRLLTRPYANYQWDAHGWDRTFEGGQRNGRLMN